MSGRTGREVSLEESVPALLRKLRGRIVGKPRETPHEGAASTNLSASLASCFHSLLNFDTQYDAEEEHLQHDAASSVQSRLATFAFLLRQRGWDAAAERLEDRVQQVAGRGGDGRVLLEGVGGEEEVFRLREVWSVLSVLVELSGSGGVWRGGVWGSYERAGERAGGAAAYEEFAHEQFQTHPGVGQAAFFAMRESTFHEVFDERLVRGAFQERPGPEPDEQPAHTSMRSLGQQADGFLPEGLRDMDTLFKLPPLGVGAPKMFRTEPLVERAGETHGASQPEEVMDDDELLPGRDYPVQAAEARALLDEWQSIKESWHEPDPFAVAAKRLVAEKEVPRSDARQLQPMSLWEAAADTSLLEEPELRTPADFYQQYPTWDELGCDVNSTLDVVQRRVDIMSGHTPQHGTFGEAYNRYRATFLSRLATGASQALHSSLDDEVVAEEAIVRHSISVLQGLGSRTFFFDARPERFCFLYTACRLSTSGRASLGSVMEGFALTGTLVRTLHLMADALAHGAAQAGGLVRQAFGQALKEFMTLYCAKVMELGDAVRQRRASEQGDASEGAQSGLALTLMELVVHVRSLSAQVAWLADLCHCSMEWRKLQELWLADSDVDVHRDGPPSPLALALSALPRGGRLLSYLYSCGLRNDGDPSIDSLVRFLFRRASAPYLRMLDAWMYRGRLVDPFGEFLVEQVRRSNIASRAKRTSEARRMLIYTANQRGETREQQYFALRSHEHVPDFLRDLQTEIFICGQTMRVLHTDPEHFACCTVIDRATTAGVVVPRSPIRFAFHMDMLERLRVEREALVAKQRFLLRKLGRKIRDQAAALRVSRQVMHHMIAEEVRAARQAQDGADKQAAIAKRQAQVAYRKKLNAQVMARALMRQKTKEADDAAGAKAERERREMHQREAERLRSEHAEAIAAEEAKQRRLRWRTRRTELSAARERLWKEVQEREEEEAEEARARGVEPAEFDPDKANADAVWSGMAPVISEGMFSRQAAQSERRSLFALRSASRGVGLFAREEEVEGGGEEVGSEEDEEEAKMVDDEEDDDEDDEEEEEMKAAPQLVRAASAPDLRVVVTKEEGGGEGEEEEEEEERRPHSAPATPVAELWNAGASPVEERGRRRSHKRRLSVTNLDLREMFGTKADQLQVQLFPAEHARVEQPEVEEGEEGERLGATVTEEDLEQTAAFLRQRDEVAASGDVQVGLWLAQARGRREKQPERVHGAVELALDDEDSHARVRTGASGDDHVLLSVAARESVAQSLRAQFRVVNDAALHLFFTKLHLKAHFETLREFCFMHAGDVMDKWASSLFDGLVAEPPTDWHMPANLMAAFSSALATRGYDADQFAKRIRMGVHSDGSAHAAALEASQQHPDALETFDHVRVEYELEWPLNIVISEQAMVSYNRVFSFLLRIKRVDRELRELWTLFTMKKHHAWHLAEEVASKADEVDDRHHRRTMSRAVHDHGRRLLQLELYRHEMQHVIDTLRGYLITQVLDVSWIEFQEKLGTAETIFDLRRVHDEYLARAVNRCFLGAKLKSVMQLCVPTFKFILSFKAQVAYLDLNQPIPERSWDKIGKVVRNFRRYSGFLFTLVRKLAQRGFKQLQDLAVRLDFNGFFAGHKLKRSESGSTVLLG